MPLDYDIRSLGEALNRISRKLHEHTSKLEVAVEGTYAGESGDPRVRLLSDSLRISRDADLELSRLNESAKRVILTLRDQLEQSSQPALASPLPSFPPSSTAIGTLEREREALNTSLITLKEQHGELETLYEIARYLNSTLDFNKVLTEVMDQVIRVVKAERGFLMLVNERTKEHTFAIARDNKHNTLGKNEFNISMRTIDEVVRLGEARLADNAQEELKGHESIVAHGIRSIICAPLKVRDVCIGAVYVDSRITAKLFTEKHRDLMLAFCNQAAIAINNARLFEDLNRALRKVEEDRQYMDNIFASIANGVITTDSAGSITKFNDAAGLILRINPMSAIGRHYRDVFRHLPQLGIVEMLQHVPKEHDHGTIVPRPLECEIPGRGPGTIHLTLYASALRDGTTPIGTALVLDDRTEQKRAEASAKNIRRLFGRYVHPNVVQQLIDNPNAVNLGGEVKEISVISTDIRGFTRLSERLPSREVMNLLNTYYEIMVKAIWDEEGTVTGFWGDAMLAIFNAPLSQPDHALRAVRAAWNMRQAVLAFQKLQPPDLPIAFGIGVNTGEVIVGNVGSQDRIQNYTAIGDTVNVAARLQENASDNNIILNHRTFSRVRQQVRVEKLPSLMVKNKTGSLDVWRLVGLL
ncbi:MAG TPA: adenylate/guanylate cyclase domain-containing protein [Ktedonobacteraceae bacterium]|nr:adenylate/guanylate cyclase domain-containing protein [Ktedonobacteraceae bacterium]